MNRRGLIVIRSPDIPARDTDERPCQEEHDKDEREPTDDTRRLERIETTQEHERERHDRKSERPKESVPDDWLVFDVFLCDRRQDVRR